MPGSSLRGPAGASGDSGRLFSVPGLGLRTLCRVEVGIPAQMVGACRINSQPVSVASPPDVDAGLGVQQRPAAERLDPVVSLAELRVVVEPRLARRRLASLASAVGDDVVVLAAAGTLRAVGKDVVR